MTGTFSLPQIYSLHPRLKSFYRRPWLCAQLFLPAIVHDYNHWDIAVLFEIICNVSVIQSVISIEVNIAEFYW